MQDLIDFDEISRRMREAIAKRPREFECAESVEQTGRTEMHVDLEVLRSTANIRDVSLFSHRMMLGFIVVLFKKCLCKLLTPILDQQVAYNLANVRFGGRTTEQLEQLSGEIKLIASQLETMQDKIEEVRKTAIPKHENEMKQMQMQVMRLEEIADERFSAELEKQAQEIHSMHAQLEKLNRNYLFCREDSESPTIGRGSDEYAELDRITLEECFRDQIRGRLAWYVDYFKGASTVLDLGCGKGEFLELLRDVGVEAAGIDIDIDRVAACRVKGLNVSREDVLAGLDAIPNGSLGGIFAGQLIERLQDRRVAQLVKLAFEKLRPAGVILIDSVHPEYPPFKNLWLWMRPSDIRPLHPDAVCFLLESAGFEEIACNAMARSDERPQHLHWGGDKAPQQVKANTEESPPSSWGYFVTARKPQ